MRDWSTASLFRAEVGSARAARSGTEATLPVHSTSLWPGRACPASAPALRTRTRGNLRRLLTERTPEGSPASCAGVRAPTTQTDEVDHGWRSGSGVMSCRDARLPLTAGRADVRRSVGTRLPRLDGVLKAGQPRGHVLQESPQDLQGVPDAVELQGQVTGVAHEIGRYPPQLSVTGEHCGA